MKLLLVEDDALLGGSLMKGLRENGYALDWARDGLHADRLLRGSDYDGVILDWMLPGLDGLSVVRGLRRRGAKTPVLMLTARDATHDIVTALDGGADDYLVKPFEFAELLARIRVLLRHKYAQAASVIRTGDLEVDLGAREARRAGTLLNLTPREFKLLELLALRLNQVVPRLEIWEKLYETEDDRTSNVVDVYISYLRRKIDRGRAPLIITRRGEGYMLRGDPCDRP
ncbi:MAG: response regulator transcription factor [Phycisphaerae bacterium]|nr:MAG: DNA-binding response regulator [Planctomycetota bacterium]KAB2948847.1 MAG: response regulator transcription factor [Phycisphaerae bacterium]MBE7455371.1 response regulator transcription factor [Planctomycetia bacterium]MCK6464183.1 response regulator transcription factor [Phycisphaerae bacterium]MCL4717643.1 response regulator transcription factor [Phycisphaerae bacterium]